MKILITGMSSRQANPQAAKRDITVAVLLKRALEDAGHTVELRDPKVEEDVSGFDHAFVGLGPLHGMGTNRSYGTLSVILRMWPNKLTLFSDDQDMGKIIGGLQTVLADPDARFTKPFFKYKKDWDVASQPGWRPWLLEGVKMLRDYEWPQFLIPAFPWADVPQLVKRIPNAQNTTTAVDLSVYLDDFPIDLDPELQRDQIWVTEAPVSDRWLTQQRIGFELEHYGSGSTKRPNDQLLVERYSQVWGVVESPIDFGWWTSRIGYAAMARSLYVTKWQNVSALGDAYGLLPDAAEQLSITDHRAWADAQAAAFEIVTSSKEDVQKTLTSLTEKVEVSA